MRKFEIGNKWKCRGYSGGGGGTDSLSLGTNCETAAPPPPPPLVPFFFKGQPLVLLSRVLSWILKNSPSKSAVGIFCIVCVIFYQIIVFKGFKKKLECIHVLYDVDYWMQPPLRSGQTAVGTLFQTPSPLREGTKLTLESIWLQYILTSNSEMHMQSELV